MCPCTHTYTDGELKLQRAVLTHTLQELLDELMVQKHWYRDRDDFTVTLQATPLIRGLSSTGKPIGEFEASKRTDELMLQLWKNLLQPIVDQHIPDHKKNILTLQCPTEDRPFLRTEFNTPSSHHRNADHFIQTHTGTELPCEDRSPSSSIPTSVHELRPADIKVVAAVGDSLTAGNGIGSSPNDILDVLRQYRGLSWCIGGDGDLTTVTTLPNILKHFNHNVKGYSLGVGNQDNPQAFLNQAVPGATSPDIPSQVRTLVTKMKNDVNINFESDWKLITIFIGGNDLCAYCENNLLYSVENYVGFLKESLDYLQKEVPRALVNLVEPLYITPLREMHMDASLNCPTWLVNMLCPCVVMPEPNSEALQILETVNRGYQRSLHELIDSGRYDTQSDFTVVIQPFLRDIALPRLPDGRPDRSYFSADCFHLSQKSQTLMARSLWNNMLEPVGSKTSSQDFNSAFDLKCSTNDSPFIRTSKNSDYTYSAPSSKTDPITNRGSDFSCNILAPSDSKPTSADTVRPSDVAVLSYVGLNEESTELSTVLSKLTELVTLFNPGLVTPISEDKRIPQFLQHGTLVDQANELSLYLQSNKGADENQDWKLVLLFVQLDRLCACEQQEQISSLLKQLVEEVDIAVQLLHSQLKKIIVSVALWDGGLNTFQTKMCPCTHTYTDGELKLQRAVLTHTLQELLDELMVQKHWYRDRDDFTVTLQATPLIRGLSSTGKPIGEFEASKRTDELMLQLWKNLLQPIVDQHIPDHKKNIPTLQCPTEDRPFLRTEFNTPSSHHRNADHFIQTHTGTELPCEDRSPSSSIPTSVHELRPADIKVVAAVGDSLTAGNGIGSSPNNVLDVLRQYRGLSWCIGGDGNLTTVTTLPNILKHFNHNVTGYSLGVGDQNNPQAFLNQAVPGAKSRDIPSQVRTLVTKMKNDNINFESDWKLITIFIGGNDLCAYCENSLLYSVENYVGFLKESLDYLQKEVPRALVNLVEPLYITPLREMHMDASLNCPTWLLNILCPCVVMPEPNSEALQILETVNRGYQRSLHELIESGRYDTQSDFTVVIQPFLRDIALPRLPDGRPDRSYFSPDCFHLSQKAQTVMARSLWNNMLEPLGSKTSSQDFDSPFELKCSTNDSPFIRTYKNSDYMYSAPSPKPDPITNWGSDFSCNNLAPSESQPTSVHMLRPSDIQVVAALGDSLTAGTGAKSNSILDLNTEYKGVSWSIGGDQTLETVTTLPNILKKFNPDLKGFSKGQGQLQKGFNMAVAGAKSLELPAQVQALIKAMKENTEVNFESDWKLVTIFIGTTDLCNYCYDQNNLSPKSFSNNLMLTLDMLYEEVPRVLVNLVDLMQVDVFKTVKKDTLGCSLQQRVSCHCVINPANNAPEIEELKRINRNYQTEIEYLISGDRYDGKEDFAVVLQPFFHYSFIPQTGLGEVDTSFFSADCFHLSERAHAEMAIALWNNMLEPVGRKQAYNNFTHDRAKIHCPSEASPFIFTKANSQAAPPKTTVDPGSITTSTISATILPKCSTPIPVWVPVVVGFVSLLAGIIICWLIMSAVQRKKSKKSAKAAHNKETGF
ncbi:phospholipase B1, membrane-associated-like [Poecilia latipinna]|uniref:phospholipase B1, membrane-associated-like n=1 Tax=Poecilia latipinna TaxID=48699 RepID=UPI00072E5DE0|nr:PREDICTED: phospholipase B1, membrane-associated-like [Poecilia latipinna]